MENVLQDDRFSHIASDPRFKRVPKKDRKVKIDKRFQSMFTDDKFKVKYSVDKRGRPVNYSSSENLRNYYSLSSEDDGGSEEEEDGASSHDEHVENPEAANSTATNPLCKVVEIKSTCDSKPFSTNEIQKSASSKPESESATNKFGFDVSDISENDTAKGATVESEKKISEHVKEKLRNLEIDYARGEGNILTDSSSDDESSDDSVEEFEERMAHEWGELDKDAGTTDTSTNRLAVCNMDWDRIKASDLMVLFSSFTPKEGFIKSVAIYPSEYGKQRMEEEEVKGPIELTSQNDEDLENDGGNEDAEEGNSFHMEKLRKYQLNRLKYFYAVVVCDSVATADKIYMECDGLEYESSAIRLDLRFIPEVMTFDEEPREICNGIPDPSKYQPRHFVTKALQQAKVECTWDETNLDRIELTEKIMKSNGEVNDEDIQAYLASSSGESEDENADNEEEIIGDEEERVAKYRALIKDIQEKEKAKSSRDVEMEVTWGFGLKQKTEKLVKEKMKEQKEDLTPFEKYLEKRKEKKKLKKKERKANAKDEEKAFSDDDIPSDVDLNDPYFKEELGNVKKTDKIGKKSKGRRKKVGDDSSDDEARRNARAELELLVMENESKEHFNINSIMKQEKNADKKKKRKSKKRNEEEVPEDNFQINVNDPRFEALFSSHHFNIDPADPHYRKTKAMETLVSEKLSRRDDENRDKLKPSLVPESNQQSDPELSALVKSIKRKAVNMYENKKKKKNV